MSNYQINETTSTFHKGDIGSSREALNMPTQQVQNNYIIPAQSFPLRHLDLTTTAGNGLQRRHRSVT